MQLTKNFTLDEFACRDGTPVPEGYVQYAKQIALRAQVLRTFVGGPLRVVSGYRTPEWNKRIGGARRSRHLTASAMDIRSDVYSAEELATFYEGLTRVGLVRGGGLGIYARGWIHIDLGPIRRWRG